MLETLFITQPYLYNCHTYNFPAVLYLKSYVDNFCQKILKKEVAVSFLTCICFEGSDSALSSDTGVIVIFRSHRQVRDWCHYRTISVPTLEWNSDCHPLINAYKIFFTKPLFVMGTCEECSSKCFQSGIPLFPSIIPDINHNVHSGVEEWRDVCWNPTRLSSITIFLTEKKPRGSCNRFCSAFWFRFHFV